MRGLTGVARRQFRITVIDTQIQELIPGTHLNGHLLSPFGYGTTGKRKFQADHAPLVEALCELRWR
jgi:hypothetical protein